ncbi:MAG: ParB/RepB/Spo0J family partition protein [Burkholderiaceae bacterium]
MKTFNQMVDNKEVQRRKTYQIDLDSIHEEPGFNLRIEDEDFLASIKALADFIIGGGKVPPLEVRPRDEGGVWIVDGHRRVKALKLARKHGAEVGPVPVEPFSGDEAQRVARIMTSAEGRPLSPIEQAEGYRRLIAQGLSAADVAKLVNRTRQQVDNILMLASAPESIREMVRDGLVSATLAVETLRKDGEEKAVKKLEDALHKVKAEKKEGKKAGRVTAASVKEKRVPVALYEALFAAVGEMLEADTKKPDFFKVQQAFNEIADAKS